MIITWLCYKNLPKNFFHDNVTQNFFAWFNNQIPVPNKNQVTSIAEVEFTKMQNNLKNILNKNISKFAFTIDAWSAKTRKSFYGITIHYVDENWVLQSCILDFVPSDGKHAGLDIAKIFLNVLEFYNITNKVAGITVDNVSANSTFIQELGNMLLDKSILFDPENQHFRCLAHVINLSVQDILSLMEIENDNFCAEQPTNEDGEQIEDTFIVIQETDNCIVKVVKKVRQLHNKIRNTESLTNKLENCCNILDIKYKKPISDSKTRWNSSFEMLKTAYHLKSALDMLCKNNKDINQYLLKAEEWNFIKLITDFLEDFKKVSEKISGEKYVTLPLAVVAFNCLLDKIEKKSFVLDDKVDRNQNDEKLIQAFQKGRDKLIKHYNKCNWIYCVSLILDPRIKAEGLDLTTWGREMKKQTLEKFKSLYKEYYDEYSNEKEIKEPSAKKRKTDNNNENTIDFEILFLKSDVTSDWEKEINNYLQSPRPGPKTDILVWWKNYSSAYPIISRMAKDILCIPATSVPIERVFSEASQVVTKNRCSLENQSMRELICINRWMNSSLKRNICEVYL